MKADINVTPLIDVLLVLLIIFMLVTPSAPTALDASLPEPPQDRTKPQPSPGLLLEVAKDDYRLNSTPVLSAADLGSRLRTAFESRSDHTLFVRVDMGVPYARVIAALDLARESGASRIGLVDDPAAK
jgi:biopolymer transport protein TolR